jgi:glycerophosphoryl diester phosphodiesterase
MSKIFAHRGSAGTHPENTMAAYIEAEKVGADGLEIDVHFTKDNQLAVIHDDTVDRTTNGTGRVKDHTLAELQKLDAGSWFSPEFHQEKILSLHQVLEWIQGNQLMLNIELKYVALDYIDFEKKVIQAIEDYDLADRVIISSYNHYALQKVNELNPQIECGVLYMARLYEPWDYAQTIGAKALHPYALVTDPEMIKRSEEKNIAVRVYTVNKVEHLHYFIQANCPAIITDYPERALEIRKKLNTK